MLSGDRSLERAILSSFDARRRGITTRRMLDKAKEHGKRGESRNGGSGGDGKRLLRCCEAPDLAEEILGIGGRDATCASALTQHLINFRGLFAVSPVAPRRAEALVDELLRG